MMALPPLEAGAVHEMVASALSPAAAGVSGALGTVDGVTGLDVPAGPVPAALMATTENV